jgi:cytidine deaminase
MRNVELKARDPDPARSLERALALGAAEVAVTAERMDFCPPCGGCRQRLAEFAGPDTRVHLGTPGGPYRTVTVGELLPLAFELDPPG